MFKNLKIGVRLGFGFGFVLVLLTVISALSYLRVGQLSTEVSLMVNDRFPKTVLANDMVDAVNVIARAMRNMLLEKKEEAIKKEVDRIEAQRKIIGERLEKLTATIKSDKGKEVLKKISDARALEKAVSSIHFTNRPFKCRKNFLRLVDDWGSKMRNTVVLR